MQKSLVLQHIRHLLHLYDTKHKLHQQMLIQQTVHLTEMLIFS